MIDLETPSGPAQVDLHEGDRGALVLGHGAGGSVRSKDLQAVRRVGVELGWTVALVTQPYRVAGRRSPPPAPRLDAAWLAVLEQLELPPPLVVGGRSSGARVACRTAGPAGAAGVLCLSFPVHPPGRPGKSRLDELDGVTVPVLVVQGAADPFGIPPGAPGREVVEVRGTHTLTDLTAVEGAARDWLTARSAP